MRSQPGVDTMRYERIGTIVLARKCLILVACSLVLFACAESKPDFCKYLSLDEARLFDPGIVESKMRQTKGLLYCVWGDGASDKLFISLDRALDYSPSEFLQVVAQNSTGLSLEQGGMTVAGNQIGALFLEENDLKLEFVIAQNDEYSITIRAPGIDSEDSRKLGKLYEIADTVLARL